MAITAALRLMLNERMCCFDKRGSKPYSKPALHTPRMIQHVKGRVKKRLNEQSWTTTLTRYVIIVSVAVAVGIPVAIIAAWVKPVEYRPQNVGVHTFELVNSLLERGHVCAVR